MQEAIVSGLKVLRRELRPRLFLAVLLMSAVPVSWAMSFRVTTQMSQDGVVDKDRYFIFDFLTFEKNCAVTSITINNVSCSSKSIGEGKGFWLKVEYDSTWEGSNLRCVNRNLGDGRTEIRINQKIAGGDAEITHRLIVPSRGFGPPIDYSGSLSKFSTILNRFETASYLPLRQESAFSAGWENISMGCPRMTVPKIEALPKSKK